MRLGELISVSKGKKPRELVDVANPGYRRALQIQDLRPDAQSRFCPPFTNEVLAEPSDLLLAWDGANAGESSWGLTGSVGSTLARLRIRRPADADTAYVGHFLRARQTQLREHRKGATVPHVDGAYLANLEIPLPLLSEQRRIAAILDQADALRAKRRQTSALLEDLAQAVFLDLLTSPEADGWPVVKVADVAAAQPNAIRTGPFGSQLLHSEFVNSGVAVLGIDNAVTNEFRWAQRRYITEEKYQSLIRYTVRPGDVLITIMGTCGRCAVVPDDIPLAINTKHLCSITPNRDRCLPEFLHASFLWQPLARRYLKGATKGAIMEGLNMGLIKGIPMVLPPIEVQRNWVHRLEALRGLRAINEASSAQLDEALAALQAVAFSGRLEQDPVDAHVEDDLPIPVHMP